jgi:Domain of unknown function (DUF4381)
LTNSELADQIPQLKPPHGEIPPGFWEQYGIWVIVAGLIFVYLVAWVIWLVMRKRKPMSRPPEVEANEALAAIRGQPENGETLAEISRIVKTYFVRAFNLPPQEHTTAEIAVLARESRQIGPGLGQDLGAYLAELDRRKFALGTQIAGRPALEQAEELIQASEGRRKELRAREQAAAKQQHARQS